MSLFKQKINQQVYKGVISASLVISLSVATITPQTANAVTQENVLNVAAILNVPISTELINSQAKGFPVASERKGIREITVVATAYNSLAAQTDSTPCITANGFDLCKFYKENGFGNTIAANFLPLGTQVKFPELYGDKIFVVRDRMNARYGYGRVDIWLLEYGEARMFGSKRLKMEIF